MFDYFYPDNKKRCRVGCVSTRWRSSALSRGYDSNICNFRHTHTHKNVDPLSSFTAAEYPQTERGNIAFRVSASSWAKQHIEGCIYVVVFVGKIKTINTKGRVKFNFCVWGKTYFHETEPHIYDELHLFFLLRKLSKSLSVYD